MDQTFSPHLSKVQNLQRVLGLVFSSSGLSSSPSTTTTTMGTVNTGMTAMLLPEQLRALLAQSKDSEHAFLHGTTPAWFIQEQSHVEDNNNNCHQNSNSSSNNNKRMLVGAFMARAMSEQHWIEEWVCLQRKFNCIGFYHADKCKPHFTDHNRSHQSIAHGPALCPDFCLSCYGYRHTNSLSHVCIGGWWFEMNGWASYKKFRFNTKHPIWTCLHLHSCCQRLPQRMVCRAIILWCHGHYWPKWKRRTQCRAKWSSQFGTKSVFPSKLPSSVPSKEPSVAPSEAPSMEPSQVPSKLPSSIPSKMQSAQPSSRPSTIPISSPSATWSCVHPCA